MVYWHFQTFRCSLSAFKCRLRQLRGLQIRGAEHYGGHRTPTAENAHVRQNGMHHGGQTHVGSDASVATLDDSTDGPIPGELLRGLSAIAGRSPASRMGRSNADTCSTPHMFKVTDTCSEK
jgi:hypothetical protein